MVRIGTKFSGFASLSDTAPQLLGGAAMELPDNAKNLIAMIPYISSPAGNTAGEPVAGYAYLTCESLKLDPYYVLAQPIGSSLLKSVAQMQGNHKDVMYPVNAKLTGNESIKAYGAGLFEHTIEPIMAVLLIYGDVAPQITKGEIQFHAKIGTFTNTGIDSARVAGSGISIVGGTTLRYICGMAVGTTVAALKGLAGHIDFTSTGFAYSWNYDLPINPISGQVDTNIQECVAGIMRLEVFMPMHNKTTINTGFTLAADLTTTGNWIAGVLYN